MWIVHNIDSMYIQQEHNRQSRRSVKDERKVGCFLRKVEDNKTLYTLHILSYVYVRTIYHLLATISICVFLFWRWYTLLLLLRFLFPILKRLKSFYAYIYLFCVHMYLFCCWIEWHFQLSYVSKPRCEDDRFRDWDSIIMLYESTILTV